MQGRVKWLTAGACALVLGAGSLAFVNYGCAADDDDSKKATEALRKVGKALEGGKEEGAKKEIAELTKMDLGDIMEKFKPRDKGGFGVGPKEDVYKPDSIQDKVQALGKKPLSPAAMAKEMDDIAQMGLDIASIAVGANAHTPKTKAGAKDPKDWKLWTDEMKKAGMDLNKAAKAKDIKGVKAAATKIQSSCSNCHGVFRDS
jgi:Cytochrome C'